MKMEERKDVFSYKYSAQRQDEINKIRQKYINGEEDKLEQLRRLDEGVVKKGQIYSLIIGVVGVLVLGLGMSCCMVWKKVWFVPGIFIGIAGLVAVSLAYPIYSRTVKAERKKIAPEIIRLTDELMKD